VIDLAFDARRENFHLSVECRLASDWTVFFGPSGAGKTTLLRLLAGLDRGRDGSAPAGRMVFEGSILTDTARKIWVRPGRRQTAFVTQNTGLFPHLNVEANVAFGLDRLEKAGRRRRVEEMLDLVGGSELRDRRAQEVSGGQAQRVALARALATGPKLLLLDEPFSALDGSASDELLERLQFWGRQNGVQSVMATHDAADALAIDAEVLLLREGRMAAQGPASQVLAAERGRLLGRLNPQQMD
jgi:ABC-type sulfate/molybdate transport systems ATPase subunit